MAYPPVARLLAVIVVPGTRLPREMVSKLTCQVGRLIEQHTPEQWLWKKRRVQLVDGTTVTMPDTKANQEVLPQQRRQKPGLGFPICRVVGITCLSTGALIKVLSHFRRGSN